MIMGGAIASVAWIALSSTRRRPDPVACTREHVDD